MLLVQDDSRDSSREQTRAFTRPLSSWRSLSPIPRTCVTRLPAKTSWLQGPAVAPQASYPVMVCKAIYGQLAFDHQDKLEREVGLGTQALSC